MLQCESHSPTTAAQRRFYVDRTDDRRCDHRHPGVTRDFGLPDLHGSGADHGRPEHGRRREGAHCRCLHQLRDGACRSHRGRHEPERDGYEGQLRQRGCRSSMGGSISLSVDPGHTRPYSDRPCRLHPTRPMAIPSCGAVAMRHSRQVYCFRVARRTSRRPSNRATCRVPVASLRRRIPGVPMLEKVLFEGLT